MRPSALFLLWLIYLPQISLSQTFYEVFQAQDPHPTDSPGGTAYGTSADIAGDWAIVGSENGLNVDSAVFRSRAGAVYVYHRDAKGDWAFYQKLVASDRQPSDLFGSATSFGHATSIDSSTVLIGAFGSDWYDTTNQSLINNAGAGYIFELDSNGVWQEEQKLVLSDPWANSLFGLTVSLDETEAWFGTRAKRYVDSLGNVFINTGAAYVFQKDQTGTWHETEEFIPPNPTGEERFGHAVDVSGSWAAVSAPRADRDTQGQWLTDAGAVYLYQRDNNAQWHLAQILTPSDRSAFDWFGFSLSLHDSLLMVGAMWDYEDSLGQNPVPGAGSAYIFRLQPNGEWVEQQKLSGPYRASQAHFGLEVEIHGDYAMANTLTQPPSNSVSIFRLEGDRWQHLEELRPANGAFGDGFGQVISMSGSTLLAAASPREYMYIFEACDLAETVLRDTICPGSGYDFGGEWLTTGGMYADTLNDYRGCDSIIRLDLAFLSPPSTVYEDAGSLSITAPGASVQWLDCLNAYAPVPAATDLQFFPQQSGSYAAAVSQYGCIDTSECVAFVIAGTEKELGADIQVFPNPVENTLQVISAIPIEEVGLYSLQGQLLSRIRSGDTQISLDMIDLPTGVYLLQIQTPQGRWQQKVLKQ